MNGRGGEGNGAKPGDRKSFPLITGKIISSQIEFEGHPSSRCIAISVGFVLEFCLT